MKFCVSYEHSLSSAPGDFIVHVPSQVVADVPANVPRALLPELTLQRSSRIGRIRNLRLV